MPEISVTSVSGTEVFQYSIRYEEVSPLEGASQEAVIELAVAVAESPLGIEGTLEKTREEASLHSVRREPERIFRALAE